MTKQNDMIEEKNLTKLLRVNFTGKERLDIGEQMANAVRNIKQAEDDLASVSSQFKSDIKKFEAELSGLAEKLNSGWEMKSVNCVLTKNFETKSYIIQRLDTMEIVEERAMTVDELQMGLPGIAAEKEAEGGGDAGQPEALDLPPTSEGQPEPDLPEDKNPFYTKGKKGKKGDNGGTKKD